MIKYSVILLFLFFSTNSLAQVDRVIKSRHQDKDIKFEVNDGGVDTEAMIIQGSTARVGIGESSPEGRLHVKDPDSTEGPLFERNTSLVPDTVREFARFKGTKSTNMGDGFGPVIAFDIEDDAAVNNTIGLMGFIRDGADNSGAFTIWNYSGGTATEEFKITSVGNVELANATWSNGQIKHGSPAFDIRVTPTSSGVDDDGQIRITAAAGISQNQGAFIKLHGVDHDTEPGDAVINAGASGDIFLNGSVIANDYVQATQHYKATASGVTLNDGATVNLFSATINSAYMIMVAQEGVGSPNASTCWVFVGNSTTAGSTFDLETGGGNQFLCGVSGGNVTLTNNAGGMPNVTVKWSAIALY